MNVQLTVAKCSISVGLLGMEESSGAEVRLQRGAGLGFSRESWVGGWVSGVVCVGGGGEGVTPD